MKKLITFLLLVTCASAFATSSHNYLTHFTRIHFPGQAEMRMCTTMVTKKVAKVDAVVAVEMLELYYKEEVKYIDEQVISLKDMGDHFFGKAILHGFSHSHDSLSYIGPVVTYMVTFEDGDQTEFGPYAIDTEFGPDDATKAWMTQELENVQDAESTFSMVHHFGYAS